MRKAALAGLVLTVFLAACSANREKSESQLGFMSKIVKAQAKKLFRKKAKTGPAQNPLAGLKRADLATLKDTLVMAHLETTNAYAVLYLVGSNRGFLTLFSADKKAITLKDGVLVDTRGLAGDLMQSDSSGLRKALGRGRDSRPFSHDYAWLNGEDHLVPASFSCVLQDIGPEKIEILERSYATRHLRERCKNDTLSFQNDFWASPSDGTIWKSRQWVSDKIGYISLQLLVK